MKKDLKSGEIHPTPRGEGFSFTNNHKPFALFTGQTYYPSPGWMGYDNAYETLEDAANRGKEISGDCCEWWQVVDLRILKIVAGEGSGHTGLFGHYPANPNE